MFAVSSFTDGGQKASARIEQKEDAPSITDTVDAFQHLLSFSTGAHANTTGDQYCPMCRKGHSMVESVLLTASCCHTFNRSCLSQHIQHYIQSNRATSIPCPQPHCTRELDTGDIQCVLSASEFEEYLQSTLLAFIEADSSSFICPNDQCRAVISIAPFHPPPLDTVITERDDSGNLLTYAAYSHFSEFRVRCRECNFIFCASCKVSPYHKGLTCSQFADYQSARHCRFCSAKLDVANLWKNPGGSVALRDVCSEADCVVKAELSCDKMLQCGCACQGIKGETQCLPCLTHELDLAEEFCGICYVESLKDAPCIQMSGPCTHVFHYQCVKTKIASRWPGARISFDFRCCPVCKQTLNHPAIKDILEPVLQMEAVVHDKGLQRLKYEGRDKDEAIVKLGGEFYNNPVGFAMKTYLFYQCFKCSKPYFAGGYQCQEAANIEFDPAELICPACQPQSVEDCKVHGKDWLAYKCRYCCSFANWYCIDGQSLISTASGLSTSMIELGGVGQSKPKIVSYDSHSQSTILADLTKRFDQGVKECLELTMMDGRTLVCTPDHEVLTSAGWQRADSLVTSQICLSTLDATEDRVDAINEPQFSLYLPSLALSLTMKTSEARSQSLAFARLAGLVYGMNGQRQFIVDHGRDYEQLNDDYQLITGQSLPAGQHHCHAICETETVVLDESLVSACSKSLALEYLLTDRCPTSFVREWLAAFFGTTTAPLQLTKSERSFTGMSVRADDCPWITALTERLGLPESCWRRNLPSNTVSLRAPHLPLLSALVGLRFSAAKLARLTAASMFYRTKAFNKRAARMVSVEPRQFLTIIHATELFNPLDQSLDQALPGLTFALPFLSSRPVTVRQVYDLAVKSSHSFVANGLIVHNCWGNTHFCDRCHKSGVWQQLTIFRSGKNKKKMWEYDNCQSLKGPVEAIGKDSSLNDDEKEARIGKLLANPKECVLGVRHPPTGIEFGLGCSMCEDSQSSSEKLKENEAAIRAKLQTIKNELKAKGARVFHYQADFDTNGVMYYLGTCGRTQAYQNPAEQGFVRVISSGLMGDSAPLSAAVGRELVRCVTTPVRNSWFVFELNDLSLTVTSYTLKHYNSWDTECLRNWSLEGCNEGISGPWETIVSHVNDTALAKKGATHTWQVPQSAASQGKRYRFFRLIQTGRNSNNNFYLPCSGIEFYGTLHLSEQQQPNSPSAGAAPVNPVPSVVVAPPPGPRPHVGRIFHHEFDFDTRGVCYFLGTKFGSVAQWTNPADLGLVRVTCSELVTQPPSEPTSAVVGRETVRCASANKPNQWFVIDFTASGYRVRPSAYTLRHYSSWDLEALRNWKMEGSINGHEWFVLSVHTDDRALHGKGSTHTWPLPNQQGQFAMFRITQTDVNSNNHYYLALSGFEVYGGLCDGSKSLSHPYDGVRPAVPVRPTVPQIQPRLSLTQQPMTLSPVSSVQQQQQQVAAPVPSPTPLFAFQHQFDMDTNGLFYFLGTNGRRQQWINPADARMAAVTSSLLSTVPPSAPASALLGRAVCRVLTVNKGDMWFALDLQSHLFAPTDYTLQHYNSVDTEAVRNWKLEGSLDGVHWQLLRLHQEDRSTQRKGMAYTWPIPNPEMKFYRRFRLTRTGPQVNLSEMDYFALSGIEMYGTLKWNGALVNGGSVNGIIGSQQQQQHVSPVHSQSPSLSLTAHSNPPALPTSRPSLSFNTPRPSIPAPPIPSSSALSIAIPAPTPSPSSGSRSASQQSPAHSPSPSVSLNPFAVPVPSPHQSRPSLPPSVGHSPSNSVNPFASTVAINSHHSHNGSVTNNPFANYVAAPAPAASLSSPRTQRLPSPPAVSRRPFTEGMEFVYHYDFDEDGILYYLGTRQLTQQWRNPADLGLVTVTSVPLAVSPPSEPASVIVGRQSCRCVTQPNRESWFVIDFQQWYVRPTHYTLRHYDSFDLEALRDWKLQGSNDGQKWTKLVVHKGDQALNGKGSTHSWPVPPTKKAYRMFRILQTGKNSNGHWYCALAGFEIYGQLFAAKPKD